MCYSSRGCAKLMGCAASIVAVHGLNFKNSNNHARKTWTMNDKLWLKDFLPVALLPKHARVMLFEYNSSPAIGATAIKLSGHANNLLQWLKLKRKVLYTLNKKPIFD